MDKNTFKNKLILFKVDGYALFVSDSETSSHISGYYLDYEKALVDSKKAGWYGANGEVQFATVFKDIENNIFEVKSLGKFVDMDQKEKQKTLSLIKSKLSDEEIKFLGI